MEKLKEEVESVIDSKKGREDLKELLACYTNMLNELDSEIWRTMKKISSGSFNEIESIDWHVLAEAVDIALSNEKYVKEKIINCIDYNMAEIYCSVITERIRIINNDLKIFFQRFGFSIVEKK